jgi:hypothetical protein
MRAVDPFFDAEACAELAFRSGAEALVAVRALLYGRDRADVPFLLHLIQASRRFGPLSICDGICGGAPSGATESGGSKVAG